MTNNKAEAVIKDWLSKQSEYVDNIEDLTSVCLDGRFDIEELINVVLSSMTDELVKKLEGEKMKSCAFHEIDNPALNSCTGCASVFHNNASLDKAIEIIKNVMGGRE